MVVGPAKVLNTPHRARDGKTMARIATVPGARINRKARRERS